VLLEFHSSWADGGSRGAEVILDDLSSVLILLERLPSTLDGSRGSVVVVEDALSSVFKLRELLSCIGGGETSGFAVVVA